MGFFSRFFGRDDQPARPDSRAAMAYRVNYRMVCEGLRAMPAEHAGAAILSALVGRGIVGDPLPASQLEHLSNRIGRMAHEQARREAAISQPNIIIITDPVDDR